MTTPFKTWQAFLGREQNNHQRQWCFCFLGWILASVALASVAFLVSALLASQKKDHQTELKLNENEAKWVPGPSSLLVPPWLDKGKSEGFKLCHGGKHGAVSEGASGETDDPKESDNESSR